MHERFTSTHRSVLVVGFLSALALLLADAPSAVSAIEVDPGEAPPAARVTKISRFPAEDGGGRDFRPLPTA